MRDAPTERLIAIVGTERAQHPPDVVVAAEAELRTRTSSEAELQFQKLRRAGLICAGIGALMFVWGLVGYILFAFALAGQPEREQSEAFMFRNFDTLFISTTALESLAGLSLLIGGIAVRKRISWGAKPIIGAIWAGIVYTVAFSLLWVVTLFTGFGQAGVFGFVMGAFGVVMAAFWVFVLYFPLRYFRSARVSEALNGPAV